MMAEKWGAYNSLHCDFELFETKQEAMVAAEAMLESESDEGIAQEIIDGGIKVFRVTHESAAIDTWTREEEIERNGSADFDTYYDMAIVKTVPPIYTPVKPEDVIPGYYWLVTPDGEKTIEQIWDGYGHGALGMESPEGWVAVSEIYELGGVLYRVPVLEGEED